MPGPSWLACSLTVFPLLMPCSRSSGYGEMHPVSLTSHVYSGFQTFAYSVHPSGRPVSPTRPVFSLTGKLLPRCHFPREGFPTSAASCQQDTDTCLSVSIFPICRWRGIEQNGSALFSPPPPAPDGRENSVSVSQADWHILDWHLPLATFQEICPSKGQGGLSVHMLNSL